MLSIRIIKQSLMSKYKTNLVAARNEFLESFQLLVNLFSPSLLQEKEKKSEIKQEIHYICCLKVKKG